jgi:hypothetical protein
MSDSDKTTYAPFILSTGKYQSLIMAENGMMGRIDIFEAAGREGNGYDWTSVAEVVVRERLAGINVTFDPEAGMFSASGSLPDLQRLGEQLRQVYADEAQLRDLLTRAGLD